MMFVLEATIWLFLLVVGCLILGGVMEWRDGRLKSSAKWAVLLGVVAWGTVFYGSFVEPKILLVQETAIEIPGFFKEAGEMRVALVGDIHAGWWKKTRWVEHVVERTLAAKPEVVLLAGDYIIRDNDELEYLVPLQRLAGAVPTYAVLGNHDQGFADAAGVARVLEALGVEVLRNEMRDMGPIAVTGVDDVWFTSDVMRALSTMAGAPHTKPVILLAHNPDVVLEKGVEEADVILAAHTHGGQIRLPWIGPVPLLPTKLERHYDQGLFKFSKEGIPLFISRGVGESGVRARLFAPPTVDILNIRWIE